MNNKLTTLLTTFSVYELNSFRKYLRSPFFNENGTLLELFDLINEALRLYENVPFSKEKIWQQLFKNKPYNDRRFRRQCSDLCRLAEDFLAYKMYAAQPVNRHLDFLKVVYERNLDKFYNTTMRNAQQAQQRQKVKDGKYYYHQYALELEQHRQLLKRISRSEKVNLAAIMHKLDDFYLSEKLRHYCEWLNYREVLHINMDYDLPFIDLILQYLAQYPKTDTPSVAIYHQIARTLTEKDNTTHYFALKTLLQKDLIQQFPKRQAWEMYGYAQNYCIRKINEGQQQFLAELFDLYQSALEQNILLDEDTLHPWHYKNIVSVALRLKEYDWTKHFIEDYKTKLPIDFSENAYNFNRAKLHFEKKDYDTVIQLLHQVEYQDVFYSLDSKAMLLKTYYEKDETEALYALLDSFAVFLKRHKKLSERHRTNYLNLVKFTKKLVKLPPRNKQKVKQLKAAITQEGKVADGAWLLEKLSELA